MTDNNATPATDTALPEKDMSPAGVRGRIAAFCKHFNVDPPGKLKVRKGAVYLTDDLLAWLKFTGASIDWILLGDPLCMAATYRQKWAEDQEVIGALRKLSDDEVALFGEALAGWRAAVEARRAKLSEASAHTTSG
jgi:hypothetical protein